MALNVNPTGIFPSYRYGATAAAPAIDSSNPGIWIDLADLNTGSSDFTAAEADHEDVPNTGDYRKLLWGILDAYNTNMGNEFSDYQKPENMTLSSSALSLVDDDTTTRNYTVTFNFNIPSMDIEDE